MKVHFHYFFQREIAERKLTRFICISRDCDLIEINGKTIRLRIRIASVEIPCSIRFPLQLILISRRDMKSMQPCRECVRSSFFFVALLLLLHICPIYVFFPRVAKWLPVIPLRHPDPHLNRFDTQLAQGLSSNYNMYSSWHKWSYSAYHTLCLLDFFVGPSSIRSHAIIFTTGYQRCPRELVS